MVASDGTGARSIVDKAVAQYCDGFAWSPDGLSLATGCQVPGGLFVVGADGRDLRSVERTAAESASWSPDGKWLVFESDQTLRIVDANAGNTSRIDLRGATASAPDWSPR